MFRIEIFNFNFHKIIYIEITDGFWSRRIRDKNGNLVHLVNSGGYWLKTTYDENGI